MIRIRLLECAALQRRDFKESKALVFCIHKKRRTFSDMHHLVTCYCHQSQRGENDTLGDCNILEFKIGSFRKVMYDIQTDEKKREHHARAARLYIQDARKCYTCGSTNFLRVPIKDVLMEAKESVTYGRERKLTLNDESKRKHSIRPARGKLTAPKVTRKVSVRRMSILPSSLDDDETNLIRQKDVKKSKRGLTKFWKRPSGIAPEITEETFHPSYLEDFTYIDYRNCQCDSIITFLFWELYRHIEKSGEIHKILDIILEYSAGLIQTAQPLYAVKLLSIADEKNGVEISKANDNAEDHITKKGIILALTGDAYSALGNYAQAEKYYTAAVKLRDVRPKMLKAVCYTIVSRLYCTEEHTLCRPVKVTGRPAVLNLELASYLRRLSIVFATEDRWKMAQWLVLRSFKLAFLSVGSFLEKGEVYLATVQVLLHSRNFEIVRYIERPLVNVIDAKTTWNNPEEVTMMANIYLMMFQIRALSGKLQEAIDIGIKVWKISEALHLNALILTFVPSLIQIMLWTQHITEAVDLMRELYFLAEDDVDLSAKTWYYALSLELTLDAGIVLETYEKSYNYYKEFLAHKSITCVWRDPQSLYRLLTCLWMYQLRMGYTILHVVMYSADEYIKDVTCHDFSRIVCCIKGLECYLMLLLRCINTKHSNELHDRLQDIRKLIKFLKYIANHALIIKPRLYLLLAYLNVLRGRKSSTRFYLRKAQKFATSQGNRLIQAWIMQNTRTWKENVYNNMARYWLEYAGSTDFVAWQHIRTFSIETWSTILYPLPTPDSHI
ncbi:uncharacterized protein LOC109863037 isoform X2 [Pseudomyrmex gracilis]|uniref:uncharacterized protein LOC109863037 isoform X2 n=1 Tax=Pseudomyrmex gracilis TaxID=219809 RepID=UPI000994DE0E|nr:uncharacterized protein LOC109863037 isoform X2 [Pseudomyrmex gracilis]